MDSHTVELIVTIVCSVIASSGFWAVIQYIINKHDSSGKLLLGIAHDRIMWLGKSYLKRGYITVEEYENLVTYLYEPYLERGGNGSAKMIMEKVLKLEIRTDELE
jgi:hypothetical protein